MNIGIFRVAAVAAALAGGFNVAARAAGAEPPPLRIAYNYCTLSYTFAFYSDSEWQAEIERLASAGFNAALVIDGTFAVWRDTLRELGADDATIRAFLPDECARAWWLMGNLAGEGGPLDDATIDDDARRGKFICEKMRERGIEPILQGYTGMLPAGFGEGLVEQGDWGPYERPPLLAPTSSRFAKVAEVWYRNLEKVYGIKPKFLAGDLFHEGGKTLGIDVTAATRAVQAAQQRAFPGVVWLVQGWQKNPIPKVRAGLDPRFTVVEALVKDMSAFEKDDSVCALEFGDLPWVWCEVLNFGGNHGLYGNLKTYARLGRAAKGVGRATFRGYGALSEGFFTNQICSDLFEEMMMKPAGSELSDAELEEWVKNWHEKRYGVSDERLTRAWRLLARSAYACNRCQEGTVENPMCAQPSWDADNVSTWGPRGGLWYDPHDVYEAFALMVKTSREEGAKGSKALREDIRDIGRQVIANEARALLPRLRTDAKARERFIALFSMLQGLLARDKRFNLSTYEEQARRRAGERGTRAFKRMVTSWSDAALGVNSLTDYANREYRELLMSYYLPRWRAFLDSGNEEGK